MNRGLLSIVGAGGHARVVAAAAIAAGWTIEAFWDDREELWGTFLLGVPIRGPILSLVEDPGRSAALAIGSNKVRMRLDKALTGLVYPVIVHPFSWQAPDIEIGEGSVLFAGSVVQPGARIGRHCIVNTSASVDHDCCLGDYVQVSPGGHLAGAVTLAEGVMIGTGACMIPGVHVGAWTTVGAGAVVAKDLPPEVTAIGVPARVSG